MFQALTLDLCSEKGLVIETSAMKLFMVAKLRYQLS